MAPPPSSGHVFYIISRVLSPDGERLAVQYKGPNENVTLELLDENNDNQLWVIKSPTERTTIVPLLAGDEQAVHNLGFVATKKLEQPEDWTLEGFKPPSPEGIVISWGVRWPAPMWDGKKAAPGSEVALSLEPEVPPREPTQLWILRPAVLSEA